MLIEPRYEIDSPATGGAALNALIAAAWPGEPPRDWAPVLAHSLVHVGAFAGEQLIGFVHVAWDGGLHAFLLDPTVDPAWRRRGIGRELVRQALDAAAQRGAQWMHVDYEPALQAFYAGCGFLPTAAGLLRLPPRTRDR